MLQLMLTLRFLAKDDFQSETGDLHFLSTSSACVALSQRLDNINMPTTALEIKEGFFYIARFPNIMGVIDGALIAIQGMKSMGLVENDFMCRKGFHALNVHASSGRRRLEVPMIYMNHNHVIIVIMCMYLIIKYKQIKLFMSTRTNNISFIPLKV
jgi:hypothetical protein